MAGLVERGALRGATPRSGRDGGWGVAPGVAAAGADASARPYAAYVPARGGVGRRSAGALVGLSSDLGGGDPFEEEVAETVTSLLTARGSANHDHLTWASLTRVARAGWVDPNGLPPDERELSAVVSHVLCRGEAYGLIRRELEPGGSRVVPTRISLTSGGAVAFGRDRAGFEPMPISVFDAELVGVRGVRATVAVGAEQHLTALHDIIQEAFGWFDDHLYSFWLTTSSTAATSSS